MYVLNSYILVFMHLNLDFVVLVCAIYCDAFERITELSYSIILKLYFTEICMSCCLLTAVQMSHIRGCILVKMMSM